MLNSFESCAVSGRVVSRMAAMSLHRLPYHWSPSGSLQGASPMPCSLERVSTLQDITKWAPINQLDAIVKQKNANSPLSSNSICHRLDDEFKRCCEIKDINYCMFHELETVFFSFSPSNCFRSAKSARTLNSALE